MYFRYLNFFNSKINKSILRTPGVEFLKKIKDVEKRSKYLNFWIKRCKKNSGLKFFFFDEQIKTDSFTYASSNDFKISSTMFDSLGYYGLLIIRNALPQNELFKIISYFDDLEKLENQNTWLTKPFKIKERTDTELNVGKVDIDQFPYLKSYSDQASTKIFNKKIKPNVDMHYLKIISNSEDAIRGETYLHSDRFIPHFKMFYTPYAITENDAPFEYALQSHKINADYIEFFKQSVFFDETDQTSRNLYNEKIKVTTEPNTLYIAFTNGLHRRSDFKSKSERCMMFFQYVERFNKLNYLFPRNNENII